MRRLRRFLLKMAVILAGPILAVPAWAQLQPLPVFQSKGSFSISTTWTATGITGVQTGKVDASAFGSMLLEISLSCYGGVAIQNWTYIITGTNDRTAATSAYTVLPNPQATMVWSGYVLNSARLYEIQPLTTYINVILVGASNVPACVVKLSGILVPFSGAHSVDGTLSEGSNFMTSQDPPLRPVLIGGLDNTAPPNRYLRAITFTSSGGIPTSPTGASSLFYGETLMEVGTVKAVHSTTTTLKWTWIQNNGGDDLRCSSGAGMGANEGFILPANGGNMSVEYSGNLYCVVVAGGANQVTGTATNYLQAY